MASELSQSLWNSGELLQSITCQKKAMSSFFNAAKERPSSRLSLHPCRLFVVSSSPMQLIVSQEDTVMGTLATGSEPESNGTTTVGLEQFITFNLTKGAAEICIHLLETLVTSPCK